MDKQSLIGLGLIAAILGVWLYFSGPSKEQIAKNKHIRDSIALADKLAQQKEAEKIAAAMPVASDSVPVPQPTADSVIQAEAADNFKDFLPATKGQKQSFTIGNELLTVQIANKGGMIQQVELKEYHRAGETSPLVLFHADSTNFSLKLKVSIFTL